MSNITSKNALILRKKSILYSILHSQNTPTLCSNTPPKMGIWDVTVGVFTLLVLIQGAGTFEKKSISIKQPIFYINNLISHLCQYLAPSTILPVMLSMVPLVTISLPTNLFLFWQESQILEALCMNKNNRGATKEEIFLTAHEHINHNC
jgi:hypothetical protein